MLFSRIVQGFREHFRYSVKLTLVGDLMECVERFVVEFDDGTFALWGQFVEGEDVSILAMDNFCDATLFHEEIANNKVDQINKGTFKFLGEAKRAIRVRKVEMNMR